jgi:anti-sigma B factor antagonist
MTNRELAVAVKLLPEALSVKQGRLFLADLKVQTNIDRQCVVLDCSKVHLMDRATILVLLCCLEETMKHNGDVKLAAVTAGARSTLEITGVGRLFEIFETTDDALSSFHLHPGNGTLRISVPDSSHRAAADPT